MLRPQLMSKLSKPSKVASILDWKKAYNNTVLAVNFHKNRVGIAVASHPSLGIPCHELEPLRFDDDNDNNDNNNDKLHHYPRKNKNIVGAIDRDCLERFSDIMEEYKVCGVVVNWPLQHDTGRMGAACGRVIFALEQLWERSNENIINGNNGNNNDNIHHLNNNNNNNNSNNNTTYERGGLLSRPFCLWDAGHIDLKQQADPSKRVDVFGRCASYGKHNTSSSSETSTTTSITSTSTLTSSETTTSTIIEPLSTTYTSTSRYYNKENNYFAGKEQYHEDELTVVVGVWNDFCMEHWPDLCSSNNDVDDDDNNDNDDDHHHDDQNNNPLSFFNSGPETPLAFTHNKQRQNQISSSSSSSSSSPSPKQVATKKKRSLITMRSN